jgi:hypothetical protein
VSAADGAGIGVLPSIRRYLLAELRRLQNLTQMDSPADNPKILR